jgi:hypothetical protein
VGLALAALALLTACNVVVTKQPLFTLADQAGAPTLKPGVWLVGQGDDCKFDKTKPIDAWPDCAGGGAVHPGEIIAHDSKAPRGVFEHDPFIFAAGEPRVAQVQAKTEIASDGGSQSERIYIYAGARATQTDAAGQITQVAYWPVLCGPPPPKNKDGSDSAMGTLKPFAGMTMKPGDPTCTTDSKDAVRLAAKASEHLAEKPMLARWLRDGDRYPLSVGGGLAPPPSARCAVCHLPRFTGEEETEMFSSTA